MLEQDRRGDLEVVGVAVVEGDGDRPFGQAPPAEALDELCERDRRPVARERFHLPGEDLGVDHQVPRVETPFSDAVVDEHDRPWPPSRQPLRDRDQAPRRPHLTARTATSSSQPSSSASSCAGVEVGRRQPLQECGSRQRVAVSLDGDVVLAEVGGEEPARQARVETPGPRAAPFVSRELADAGKRREDDPAGAQDPVERGDCEVDVVDQVQRLRHDDAVEGPIGDLRSVGEVADDRGGRIAAVDVEHVSPGRTIAAVAARVFVVSDLERPAGDVSPVRLEEALDVVTVDRQAAVVPELSADGLEAAAGRPSPTGSCRERSSCLPQARGSGRMRTTRRSRKKLPAVRRGCEHAIGTRVAVRTCGAGERGGERAGRRRLELSAVALEPVEVPSPGRVRAPRVVRARAYRPTGRGTLVLAVALAGDGIDTDPAVQRELRDQRLVLVQVLERFVEAAEP